MKRRLLGVAFAALVSIGLTACALLEDSAQYFAPVAAEVVLLGAPPEATDTLSQFGINGDVPTSVVVAIGRLTEASVESSSPFSGEGVADATVTITTPNGTFDLIPDEDNPGLYGLTSLQEPEFKYVVGGEYTVNMNFSGSDYWIKFVAADAIQLESPTELGEYHEPGTDLPLRWANPVDNVVAAVFDSSGNEVYDNLPRDLNELFEFLTQSDVTSLTLPGDLFVEQQMYAIALSGLERGVVDEQHVSTNLNHLVTNAVSGAGVMSVVTTFDMPDIPEDLGQ